MRRRDMIVGAGAALLTSPAVAAETTRLPMELPDGTFYFDKVASESSVLCSHGDVIGALLWHFQRGGIELGDDRMEKGSTWVIETEDGAVVAASYRPPSA